MIDSIKELNRMERDYNSIGKKYTDILSYKYSDKITRLKNCIAINHKLLLFAVSPYSNIFKFITLVNKIIRATEQ